MEKLNKVRLFLLIGIVLAGCFVAGLVTFRVLTKEKPVEAIKKLPPNIGLSLESAHLTDTANGVKQWEIVARSAQFDKIRNVTVLDDLKTTIYSDRPPEGTVVTARTGEYDHGSQVIRLSGDVKGRANKPIMEFTSNTVIYDTKKRLLRTDDDVKYVDETLSVQGKGLEILTETGTMHVFRKVEAVVSGMKKK